jgi:hypothetical protein
MTSNLEDLSIGIQLSRLPEAKYHIACAEISFLYQEKVLFVVENVFVNPDFSITWPSRTDKRGRKWPYIKDLNPVLNKRIQQTIEQKYKNQEFAIKFFK